MRMHKNKFFRTICITLLVSFLWSITLEAAGIRTMAVLPFNNNTGDKELDWLSDGILDTMTNDLCKIKGLTIIERSKVRKCLKEIQLGMTGAIDVATAQKAGQLIGADAVIIGGYQKYANKVRLTARLVRVETGEVYTSAKTTGTMDRIFELQDRISLKFLKSLNYKISETEKDQLTIVPTKSIKAYEHYSKAIGKWDLGEREEAKDEAKRALKYDPEYKDAKKLVSVWNMIFSKELHEEMKDIYREKGGKYMLKHSWGPLMFASMAAGVGYMLGFPIGALVVSEKNTKKEKEGLPPLDVAVEGNKWGFWAGTGTLVFVPIVFVFIKMSPEQWKRRVRRDSYSQKYRYNGIFLFNTLLTGLYCGGTAAYVSGVEKGKDLVPYLVGGAGAGSIYWLLLSKYGTERIDKTKMGMITPQIMFGETKGVGLKITYTF